VIKGLEGCRLSYDVSSIAELETALKAILTILQSSEMVSTAREAAEVVDSYACAKKDLRDASLRKVQEFIGRAPNGSRKAVIAEWIKLYNLQVSDEDNIQPEAAVAIETSLTLKNVLEGIANRHVVNQQAKKFLNVFENSDINTCLQTVTDVFKELALLPEDYIKGFAKSMASRFGELDSVYPASFSDWKQCNSFMRAICLSKADLSSEIDLKIVSEGIDELFKNLDHLINTLKPSGSRSDIRSVNSNAISELRSKIELLKLLAFKFNIGTKEFKEVATIGTELPGEVKKLKTAIVVRQLISKVKGALNVNNSEAWKEFSTFKTTLVSTLENSPLGAKILQNTLRNLMPEMGLDQLLVNLIEGEFTTIPSIVDKLDDYFIVIYHAKMLSQAGLVNTYVSNLNAFVKLAEERKISLTLLPLLAKEIGIQENKFVGISNWKDIKGPIVECLLPQLEAKEKVKDFRTIVKETAKVQEKCSFWYASANASTAGQPRRVVDNSAPVAASAQNNNNAADPVASAPVTRTAS
jgi:hypothetical protein